MPKHARKPEQESSSSSAPLPSLSPSGPSSGGARIYEPRAEDRVTVGKTAAMRDDWYDAVVGHLGRNGDENQGEPSEDARKLIALLQKEKAEKAISPQDTDENILADRELEGVFPKDLPRQLVARAAAATGQGLSETGVDVRNSYIRHMNQKPWTPIQHDIQESPNNTLTSRLVPVNQHFHETFAHYGETGLGSMSGRLTPDSRTEAEKTRPVNLWKSSLHHGDRPLFEAFRSGAFIDSATDGGERAQNANAKAREVLQAALIDRLGKMTDEERGRYLQGGQRYNGNLVSIDLMSGAGMDKAMADPHHATLRGLSGRNEAYNIRWGDQPHTVNAAFDIMDFTTGVNAMNNHSLGLSSHSSDQAKANAGSWDRLAQLAKIQQNANRKSSEPADVHKRENIAALTSDIGENLGRCGDYQLPAMLANLGNLVDASVHYNCKSGKDRTGIMDAESKFMARQLDKNHGVVPNVAKRSVRGAEQNYEHDQMLWESGMLDILAKNVGGQCLKTADLANVPLLSKLKTSDWRLMKNLGGAGMLQELAGLKRYADIDTIATFEQKTVTNSLQPMDDDKVKKYAQAGQKYLQQDVPSPGSAPAPLPVPDSSSWSNPANLNGQGLNIDAPWSHQSLSPAPAPRPVPSPVYSPNPANLNGQGLNLDASWSPPSLSPAPAPRPVPSPVFSPNPANLNGQGLNIDAPWSHQSLSLAPAPQLWPSPLFPPNPANRKREDGDIDDSGPLQRQ